MKNSSIAELIESIVGENDLRRVATILLYRTNKAIKYVQADKVGLTKKFYTLKSRYIFFFIREGFQEKCSDERDAMVLCFSVEGINVKFHQVKTKKLVIENSFDISNPTEDIRQWMGEVETMYKILMKLAISLKIGIS